MASSRRIWTGRTLRLLPTIGKYMSAYDPTDWAGIWPLERVEQLDAEARLGVRDGN